MPAAFFSTVLYQIAGKNASVCFYVSLCFLESLSIIIEVIRSTTQNPHESHCFLAVRSFGISGESKDHGKYNDPWPCGSD